MNEQSSQEALLEQVAPLVRLVLQRKSGQRLDHQDTRRENVDALEIMQEVLARTWERIRGDSGVHIEDLRAYAATVAHNAWADHIRHRHPKRASLKNRIRYFLESQRSYALWADEDSELLAGRHGLQLRRLAALPAHRVRALRDRTERAPPGCIPGRSMDQMSAPDWDRMLGTLLDALQQPIGLDDLISIASSWLGVRDDAEVSLDDEGEDGSPLLTARVEAHAEPHALAETRSLLRQLWAAVLTLKADYRRAYLLNLPGPGKSRADLEVFVLNGIANVAEIEAAVGLSEATLRQLLMGLDLEPGELFELGRCEGRLELFCVLWRHLPLSDAIIGKALDLEPQQVINRRMLALRELSRWMNKTGSREVAAGISPVAR